MMYCRTMPCFHSPPSNRIPPPSAPYNSPISHQSRESSWAAPSAPQNSIASLAISSTVSSDPRIHCQVHPSGLIMDENDDASSLPCLSPSNSSLLSSCLMDRGEVNDYSAYGYPDSRMTANSYGSRSSDSGSSLMSIDVDETNHSDCGSANQSLSPSDVTDSCLGVSFVAIKNNPWNLQPIRLDNTMCSCNVTRSECTNLGERPECIGHEDLSILYRYNSFLEQRQRNVEYSGNSNETNLGDSVIGNSDRDTDWNDTNLDHSCSTCGDAISMDQMVHSDVNNIQYHSNSSLCLLSIKPCPINVNKYKLPSNLYCRDGGVSQYCGSLESVSEHTYESIQSRNSSSSEEANYYKSLRHSQHLSQTTMDIHERLLAHRQSLEGQLQTQSGYDIVQDIPCSVSRFNRSQMTQTSDMTEFMQQPLCQDGIKASMSKSRKKVLKGKLKTVGRFIQQLSKTQGSKPSNLKTLAYV